MPKTKLDLKSVKADIARGASQRDIAVKYNAARSTVRDFLTRHALTTAGVGGNAVPTGDVTREEQLEAELRELRAEARKNRSADVQAERLLEAVRATIKPALEAYVPPLPTASEATPHTQVLLLSDLHAGEVVNAEEVNGMNSYDWETLADLRMPNIHRALLSYQTNRPYPIDELQVWMLGDMVGGDLHDELARTNDFPAAEQCFKTGMLLGQFIEQLVPEYPRIVIHTVNGNHGRLPKKPAAKQVFNNFDWLAYQIAAQYTRTYESVAWNISRGNQTLAEVAGQTVLLFHGDGIRSSMPGVPWGGVMRRTNEIKKQYAERGVYLDGFAIGHFHQANAVSGPIWMNGSVKGPDEWVLKNFGYAEAPTQLLLTFNAKKGRRTDVSYINP